MSEWKFPFSKAALQAKLEKLSLQPGDVLIVRDMEVLKSLEYCHNKGLLINFNVPVVFAPKGIEQLRRADLLNLLEQLDAAETPATQAPEIATAVPL